MPSFAKLLGYLLKLRHHRLTLGMPVQQEVAAPRAPADMGEPQKIEGIRLSLASLLTVRGGPLAEFDQPGFVGVKLQSKHPHAEAQVRDKPLGIVLVLEAGS
jgi:hypothetical protein